MTENATLRLFRSTKNNVKVLQELMFVLYWFTSFIELILLLKHDKLS